MVFPCPSNEFCPIKLIEMENIFHALPVQHTIKTSAPSVFLRFFTWCKGQEKYRLGWLGAILAIHGCALTPITLFAVVLTGTNFVFYIATLVAMAIAVVTNLAAMPTKITIPAFFLSVLIEIVIIISALSSGLSLASSQV